MINIDFAMAGRAVFTVANAEGTRYTYRVTRKDPETGSRFNRPVYFVSLLTGPDNTADYTYLGIVPTTDGGPVLPFLRLTRASRMTEDSVPVRVFRFAMRVLAGIQELPEGYTIHHEGTCGRCGRALTVPESIQTGLGPVCAGRAA